MATNGLNPQIDNYLAVGCGRCPLGDTPDCKIHDWRDVMQQIRPIVLESGLTEELKWSVACYTYEGKNVVMLSAFKEFCALGFFKGVLMQDPDNILVQQGKNVQASRIIRFTSMDDLDKLRDILPAYLQDAIEVEKSGQEVQYKKTEDFDMPDELQAKFDDDPAFQAAFEALTPGRQRGYLLHFSGAKQSKTRTSRIEKYTERIFEGRGLHDR